MLEIARWVWLVCFEMTTLALSAQRREDASTGETVLGELARKQRMDVFSRTRKPFSFGSKFLGKGEEEGRGDISEDCEGSLCAMR